MLLALIRVSKQTKPSPRSRRAAKEHEDLLGDSLSFWDLVVSFESLVKIPSMGQVLSDLVRRALKSESRGLTRRGGLPVFPVRPDAAVIPASQAAKLLANEPK